MLLFFPWLVHHQIIERKIVKCTSSIQLENQLSIIQSKQSAKNKKFVLRSIFRIGFVAIQLNISKKWQPMTSFSFICKLNQQMRFSKPKKVKETNIKHFYFEKKHQLTWWILFSIICHEFSAKSCTVHMKRRKNASIMLLKQKKMNETKLLLSLKM